MYVEFLCSAFALEEFLLVGEGRRVTFVPKSIFSFVVYLSDCVYLHNQEERKNRKVTEILNSFRPFAFWGRLLLKSTSLIRIHPLSRMIILVKKISENSKLIAEEEAIQPPSLLKENSNQSFDGINPEPNTHKPHSSLNCPMCCA